MQESSADSPMKTASMELDQNIETQAVQAPKSGFEWPIEELKNGFDNLERTTSSCVEQTFEFLNTLQSSEQEFVAALVQNFNEQLKRLELLIQEEERLTKFLVDYQEMKESQARLLGIASSQESAN